jgi:hypothetical protein
VDPWVGPAIVAAIVSGLVSAAGWFVSSWQTRSLEVTRRSEKVRDFQIALRAEIASDLLNLEVADRSVFLQAVTAEYARDPTYAPFIPRLTSNAVFASIIADIHVLPAPVIAPVVHYARLRETLKLFIEDLRSEAFRGLPTERQLTMYADYLAQLDRLETRAAAALNALRRSLGINSSDEDPLTQALASVREEQGSALAEERDVS